MSDITSPVSSETFQMGEVVGEVQYVSPDDPNAKSAAEFSASKNKVVLEGIISGYKITFSNEVVKYYLVILAKDSNGDSKLFFTVVKGNNDVLLFTPVNLSTSEPFPPKTNTNIADGKVLLGVNDNAIEAAKFAAAQNGVEFMGSCSGFEIVFPAINYPVFYHIKFLGKDCKDGSTKIFFTIVETIFTKPTHMVLLFTPAKSSSENLQMGGTGGDGNEPVDGKVLLIDPNQDFARKAGDFAATENGMKFKEYCLAILIFSPALPSEQYYHLILFAEDDNGDSQLYFTIVFDNYDTPDAVLLYKPVNTIMV